MEYFNNATIVDLVERPHRGILAVLDEACGSAGPITDRIFLQTLDTHHRNHPHYTSRQVPLCPCGRPRPVHPRLVPALERAPQVPCCLSWGGGGVLGGGSAFSAGLPPLPQIPTHLLCLDLACPTRHSSAPQTRPWSLAETSGSSTMQGMSCKGPPLSVWSPPLPLPLFKALKICPSPDSQVKSIHTMELLR